MSDPILLLTYDKKKEELSSGMATQTNVGESTQMCSATPPPPPNKSQMSKCNFSSIEYKLADKSITIDPKSEKPEFVAGYSAAKKKFSAELIGSEGPCSNHNTKVFDSRYLFVSKSNSKAEVELKSNEFKWYKDGTFHSIGSAKTADYSIKTSTCRNAEVCNLVIYPDVELEFDLNIGFKEDRSPSTIVRKSMSSKNFGASINISGSYKEDGKTSKLSLIEFEEKLKSVKQVVEIAESVKNLVTEVTGDVVSIDLIYPSLSFKGYSKFEEVEAYKGKTNIVQAKSKLQLGLDPLVGVSFTWDLVSTAVATLPGGCVVAKILKRVNSLMEKAKSKKVDVSLEFKFNLTGKISGDLFYECISWRRAVQEDKKGGELAGKIEASLKTQASGELDILFCSIGGGVKAGAISAVTGSVELFHDEQTESVAAILKGEFEGLKLYFIVYTQASGIRAKSSGRTDSDDPKSLKFKDESAKLGSGEKELYNNEYMLIEPGPKLQSKRFPDK